MRSRDDALARRLTAERDLIARGRAGARALDAAEPRWWIHYSAHQLRLVAIPLWDPGRGLVLAEPEEQTLRMQMRRVEQEHALRHGPPNGFPHPGGRP